MVGLPQRTSARRFWSDHRCTLREALQWVRESRTTGEGWLGEALISFPFLYEPRTNRDPAFLSGVADYLRLQRDDETAMRRDLEGTDAPNASRRKLGGWLTGKRRREPRTAPY